MCMNSAGPTTDLLLFRINLILSDSEGSCLSPSPSLLLFKSKQKRFSTNTSELNPKCRCRLHETSKPMTSFMSEL